MKTKEFMAKVRSLEFGIVQEGHQLVIRTPGCSIVARVNIPSQQTEIVTFTFGSADRRELLNIIAEYTNTPLAEREEEKRYRVKFPGITRSGNPIYLQRETSSRDRLGVDWSDKSFICDDDNNPDSYLFTEQEIKGIHVLYWEFAEEETE